MNLSLSPLYAKATLKSSPISLGSSNLFNLRYRKSKIEVGIMGSFFKSIHFENLKKDSSGKIQKILIMNLPQKKKLITKCERKFLNLALIWMNLINFFSHL